MHLFADCLIIGIIIGIINSNNDVQEIINSNNDVQEINLLKKKNMEYY